MGNYFNTDFAYEKEYSISGRDATFKTSSTDPILSPVNGNVESKDTDSVTIIWQDGRTKFIVSNLNPSVTQNQRVSTSDKIGTANGRVKLKITKDGSIENISDYIKPEGPQKPKMSSDYDKYDSLLYKKKLNDEEKLYRAFDDVKYAPLAAAGGIAKSGIDTLIKGWEKIAGLNKESVESRKLNEEVERIKKLLK